MNREKSSFEDLTEIDRFLFRFRPDIHTKLRGIERRDGTVLKIADGPWLPIAMTVTALKLRDVAMQPLPLHERFVMHVFGYDQSSKRCTK
jgi:hypothetical protein